MDFILRGKIFNGEDQRQILKGVFILLWCYVKMKKSASLGQNEKKVQVLHRKADLEILWSQIIKEKNSYKMIY